MSGCLGAWMCAPSPAMIRVVLGLVESGLALDVRMLLRIDQMIDISRNNLARVYCLGLLQTLD